MAGPAEHLCPLSSLTAHVSEPEEELDELLGGNQFIRRTCPTIIVPPAAGACPLASGETGVSMAPAFIHSHITRSVHASGCFPGASVSGERLGGPARTSTLAGRQVRAGAHPPGVHARYEHQAGRTGSEALAGQCPAASCAWAQGLAVCRRPLVRARGKDLVVACAYGDPPRGPSAEGQAPPRPCCLLLPVPER